LLSASATVPTLPARTGALAEKSPRSIFRAASRSTCGTGEITCPVAAAMCDDTKVAVVVETPDGPAWKGVGPGVTLCGANAVSGQGMRRVFRVTVR